MRRKVILLLDGIDHILGDRFSDSSDKLMDESSDSNQINMVCRIRSVFMSAMDRLRGSQLKCLQPLEILVLSTARSHDNDISDRFDNVFHIHEPDSIERRLIIETCLGLPNDCEQIGLGELLTRVVSSTLGKSRGEIAQNCREGVREVPICTSVEACVSRLNIVLNYLQQTIPESIRSGISSESLIEIHVSSAKELRSKIIFDEHGREVLPLIGKNALECWKQVENIIIAPLCRWEALDELMYGNRGSSPSRFTVTFQKKAVSSGLLLTGDPGTGKTAIAYHCAAVATGLNPAIKLLEVSCTSLVHKELGGSERSVRKLFETARNSAPCILLLDGIENIAPVRGYDNTTEGTMDRLLSTLLTEIDGVSTQTNRESSEIEGNSIAVIGITHNSSSWIDSALLRPGRLEKCLTMKKPDNSARKDIFLNTIKDMDIDFSGAGFFDPKNKNQLAESAALRTHGRSAAEIIAICENAKILALHEVLHAIDETDEVQQNLRVSHRHFSPK